MKAVRRNRIAVAACALSCALGLSANTEDALAELRARRFGLFVHWGLYAQLGGSWKGQVMPQKLGEWIQSAFRIPNAEYARLAKAFNPTRFDADEWILQAKDAGVGYVVFTAKHHDGFSMFATDVSDYDVVDATPFGRDVFSELVAACRRHGLKVGFYYSQNLDWHEKDAGDPERGGVSRHPSNGGMHWGNCWDFPDWSQKDFSRYLEGKVLPQLRELLTNYGDIFMIWFDTPYGMTPEQSRRVRELVRALQPNTIVNSRIGNGCGDFGSMGDNQFPEGKADSLRESPITLNDTWGFRFDDHNWKTPYAVAMSLARTFACDANVLLNVGPRPDGRFPDATSDVLAELGAWRRRTGFAIRGTTAGPFPTQMPWGHCLAAPGHVLQLVVNREWEGDVTLEGVRGRVRACTVPFEVSGDRVTLRLQPPTDLMPRVVRLTLDGAPDIRSGEETAGNGKSLLANGDFERETSEGWGNWTPGAKAQVVSGAHGGRRCLSYSHSAETGDAFLVNKVPCASNGTYTVSGWIRGAAGSLGVRLFFFAPDGRYLGEEQAYSATSLREWTRFERVFKAPATAGSVGVGLQVARGTVFLDDVRVEPGSPVGEPANEIVNSAYTYRLHDDGMPEQWNTSSSYTFDTFRPGVHEGRYFRIADEVPSPVPGARVLFVDGVQATSLRMGPLAGEQDYVFSLWAKSDAPDAALTLQFAGRSETFALSSDWRRLVMKARLDKSQAEGVAQIVYDRHPLCYAAPMLHVGTEPLPWKASPSDANLPDLRAGRQPAVKAAEALSVDVPESSGWDGARVLTDFHPLADPDRTESSRFRAFVRRQGDRLLVAVECDSGKKPLPAPKANSPLELGNDAVEVFVSPSASGSPYVQLMGGRNGARAATRGAQGVSANEGWSYRAFETAKGWRAEYGLPLAFFGKPDGDCWRFNVGVTDFDGAKPRCYSAIRGGFHASGDFIRLTGLPRGCKESPPRAAAEFDFYTDENTARVAVEDAQGRAAATLRDAQGKALRTAPVSGGRAAFGLSGLADGYYEVEVEAANGTAKTHFRKAPPGTPHTRVNRFRRHIEADGKPFFPTVYSWINLAGDLPTAWHIDQLRSHNFNTVMLMPEMWADWAKCGNAETRLKTMRAFADAGFRFIVWTGVSMDKGLLGVTDARTGHIRELEAFKDRILGWYYVDEIGPFWETQFGLKPSDFAEGYRRIKAVDPARLHFINWGWTNISDGMPFYAEEGATDLYSLDCYPYTQAHYGYGALQIHERAARILNGRTRSAFMPGIMWLQTYGTQEGYREPMPVEYRNNVYVGLVNHVVGYMNFIGCPEHKDLWDEMGRSYGTALRWLRMTARPGSACLRRGRQGEISFALWKDGLGGFSLVAANTLYAPQEERLTLPADLDGLAPTCIGGEGRVAASDGALEVALPAAGSAAWFFERRDKADPQTAGPLPD